MEYKKAIGKEAHLQYAYTTDGCKENIVLDQYTGRNEFRFKIDTHGLVPRESEGHIIVLQDPQTNQDVYVFDVLDVEDADYTETLHHQDVSYNNSYRIEPVIEAGADESIYILTQIIDNEFLTAPTTQYPVTIDPITYWSYGTSDTSVFVGSSANYSASSTDYVGYHPSLGKAYKLFQCDTSALKFINPNNISRARYYTWMSGAADGWNLMLTMPQSTWTADTVKFADVSSNYKLLYSLYLGNSSEKAMYFDLTSYVQEWLKTELAEDGLYHPSRGIMFMPSSTCPTDSYRLFYSANASTAKKPAFVIEYTEDTSLSDGYYFIRNAACQRYLDVEYAGQEAGTPTSIYDFNGNDNQLWDVKQISAGKYTLRPFNAYDYYLSARDEYGCRLTLSASKLAWRLVKNADNTYRIVQIASVRQAAESANGSTENGNAVQTWGYGGYDNQKWVFEPATFAGGARAYRQENSTQIKCLGYALELTHNYSPIINIKDTVDTFYERRIVPYVESLNRKCRRLLNAYSYISPHEYKIAMRVAPNNVANDLGYAISDYHFMVQISGEEWAHKMGTHPSERLGKISPGSFSWDYVTYYSNGEEKFRQTNFYDSATAFFAVTR